MSKFRLLSSYASIAAILGLAGWAAFVSFPWWGKPSSFVARPDSNPRLRLRPAMS
jgi:hypothetical protein